MSYGKTANVFHASRGWEIEIKSQRTGNGYNDPTRWAVSVNGVNVSQMPEAPKTIDLPVVCKSDEHKKYTEMLKYAAFEFFVNAEKHVLIAKHSAKSETIDITLNKASKNLTGRAFGDTSDFPIILNDDESGVKASVDVEEEF